MSGKPRTVDRFEILMGRLMDWTWRVRKTEVKDIAQISSLSNWVSSGIIQGGRESKRRKRQT